MSDCLASPGVPDPLEERLARVLPRLESHLAGATRRVPGLDPSDVAQEVVARALRYRGSYDPERALWPWLRRTAERVLCDLRAAGARRTETAHEREPAAPEQAPPAETLEELERLLARLRPHEREALLRFHQRGQSVRAIAAAMQLPEGTVKSHLSRARKRLAGVDDLEGQA